MNTLSKILPFAVSAAVGFAVSFFVIMLAWNIQIEHRAFRCTDDVGFGFFWESMETHRGAGDIVASGWTWGKIKVIQGAYEVGFITIWLSIAAAPSLLFKRASHAH